MIERICRWCNALMTGRLNSVQVVCNGCRASYRTEQKRLTNERYRGRAKQRKAERSTPCACGNAKSLNAQLCRKCFERQHAQRLDTPPVCKDADCAESQVRHHNGKTWSGLCVVHLSEQQAAHKAPTATSKTATGKTERTAESFSASSRCHGCGKAIIWPGTCYRCATGREPTLCRADGTPLRITISSSARQAAA